MSRGCEKCQFSERVDYGTYRCKEFNEWPELVCSEIVLKKDEDEEDKTMTIIEAADEIEKLRAEIGILRHGNYSENAENEKIRTENEKLRVELRERAEAMDLVLFRPDSTACASCHGDTRAVDICEDCIYCCPYILMPIDCGNCLCGESK